MVENNIFNAPTWNELNERYREESSRKLASVREVKAVGPLIDDGSIYRSLREYLASNNEMMVTDPYRNSVWVFASINAIAQNIARVPFYLYTEKSRDIKKIITKGKLVDLFTNPNPQMITSTMFFATVLFLELYGEAFWVIERDNITQVPKEIWVVNPTRFEPVYDEEGERKIFNGSWKYSVQNFSTIFAPHEILQFKYFDPYNELRGSSGYEPSKMGVEQDYFASKYNKQFFKDGVSLSGIIKAPDFLTDDQYTRLKNQFSEKHAGYSNAHKVGVIEGGADFIETKAMSQRDMEFSVLKRVIRGEILAAFKTNEVVLGNYENIQSYEGIRQAHESFWKETLLPKIIYLEDYLWAKFFSKIEAGKLWGGFDLSVIEALREDFGKKAEIAKLLNEIGFTGNEINRRLDLGFEEKPWRDIWWVRTGMIPAEVAMENPIPEPTSDNDPEEEPGNNPNEPTPEDEPVDEPNPGKDVLDLSKRDDSMWANYIARQVPVENIFKNKLKRFLFEQRKRVLSNLYKNKEVFNEEDEIKGIVSIFTNLYGITSRVGEELLKEDLIFESEKGDVIENFINERLNFSSSIIINTLKNSVHKILEENKNKDTAIQAKKIRDLYNKTDSIINKIARTETAAVINGVRYILMKENGVKFHKWLSKSKNSRHKNLDGKVVKIGESFSKDFILRYPCDKKAPANETIQCLCYCVPVIKIK